MKHLVAQRFIIRRNMLTIISLCLFCYFSWHVIMGQRSYARLLMLEHSIGRITPQYDRYREKRLEIEGRVVRLRSGSIDRDLLDERARYVLGYVHPDDRLLAAFD